MRVGADYRSGRSLGSVNESLTKGFRVLEPGADLFLQIQLWASHRNANANRVFIALSRFVSKHLGLPPAPVVELIFKNRL